MQEETAHPDRGVARIASRQHGIIAFAQLMAAGISPDGITRRIASCRLHRVHRGVYAVGHTALSDHGRWMAAVLAGGEGAVLSHRSAAELLDLLPSRPGRVHVTVPTRSGRSQRTGLIIHRTSLPFTFVHRDAIRVSTPARTLADLRRTESPADWRRAIRQAVVLGYALGPTARDDGTRSELEHRFLRLLARHRVRKPLVNHRVGPYFVDFLWPGQRLIVETDGERFHRGAENRAADLERQNALVSMGFELLRFTWSQVIDRPRWVATTVRAALDRRRP